MSPMHCYSTRRFSPFRGTLQIIEADHVRAVSFDGYHWRIIVSYESNYPTWGCSDQGDILQCNVVYGLWNKEDHLVRVPVNPAVDVRLIARQAEPMLAYLESTNLQLPFAGEDSYELWLLDENLLPLALLASTTKRSCINTEYQLKWQPSALDDHSFESPSLTQEGIQNKLAHQPCCHREKLRSMVVNRAGNIPKGQWFQRSEEDDARGVTGIHLEEHLERRFLRNKDFPCLPLQDQWESELENKLARDFHHWQAPSLLTLPSLTQSLRAELEIAACKHPMAVRQWHRLYPTVINQDLITKTLVQAKLMCTNASAINCD